MTAGNGKQNSCWFDAAALGVVICGWGGGGGAIPGQRLSQSLNPIILTFQTNVVTTTINIKVYLRNNIDEAIIRYGHLLYTY